MKQAFRTTSLSLVLVMSGLNLSAAAEAPAGRGAARDTAAIAAQKPGSSDGAAEAPKDNIGLVLTSNDFGTPCTMNIGESPRVYDNASTSDVDVTVKIVNTGPSILFITGTGFVIPPGTEDQRRPRIFRVTLAAGTSLGILAQGTCAWNVVVYPH